MSELTTLPKLAEEINQHFEQAQHHANEAVTHALITGEALIKAKAQVKHGEWEGWLEKNTVVSVRHSQRFMKLANNREALEAKATPVSDMTLRGALKLLESPKEEDPDEWPKGDTLEERVADAVDTVNQHIASLFAYMCHVRDEGFNKEFDDFICERFFVKAVDYMVVRILALMQEMHGKGMDEEYSRLRGFCIDAPEWRDFDVRTGKKKEAMQ